MTLDDVVALVGRDRFEAGGDDVAHEVAALLWEGEPRVAVLFEVYRRMPCYAHLVGAKRAYAGFTDDERARFWQGYRTLLGSDDDRLAGPVAESLRCDFFPDPATVEEAWRRIQPLYDRGTRRLLTVAGPVPWRLKAPLYERHAGRRCWRNDVYRSIHASAVDADGLLDPADARRLLHRLAMPAETPGLAELEQRF